jgi:hypothetical protein
MENPMKEVKNGALRVDYDRELKQESRLAVPLKPDYASYWITMSLTADLKGMRILIMSVEMKRSV